MIMSRRMRLAGHVALMLERKDAYRVLVGKSEVGGPLGRPRRRWVDNIKMGLKEIELDGMDLSFKFCTGIMKYGEKYLLILDFNLSIIAPKSSSQVRYHNCAVSNQTNK
jgi:hypothetical protein